jgi:type IV pilus assembly protein PilY1
MSTFVNGLLAKRWMRWLAAPAAIVVVVGTVMSQAAPPAIPSVALASEPLYARGARAKPTLTLALSVEFPTVGAQYVGTPAATSDNSYSLSNEYIGYFDQDSCYVYNNSPTETRPSGVPVDDYKRFDRYKRQWSRKLYCKICDSGFVGI